MTKQAERDEFTVFKARLDKHLYGKQPRLSRQQMRKRSDVDPEKYNQMVVEDTQEMEHEYQSDYRGRVQNRKVNLELQPLFSLSFEPMNDELRTSYIAFDRHVEAFNQRSHSRTIYINNKQTALDEDESEKYFNYIQALSDSIGSLRNFQRIMDVVFLRAVAYTSIQNFDEAVNDLTTYLQEDTASVTALWLRAVSQSRMNNFMASEGVNVALKNVNVMADFNRALALDPNNAYLLYNRGTLYAQQQEYQKAIEDFTRAIAIDANLAEAYYNRGICAINIKQNEAAVRDLGKAGELGLYTAYSIIKKYRN